MFKIGDVAFFKVARKGTKKTAPECKFNGHAFGVILGIVPPFEKEPPAEHLLRLMGSIGFISFDDIGEIFGAEAGKKCIAAFEAKYYGRTGAPGELPKELPKIVDANGQPITQLSTLRPTEPT